MYLRINGHLKSAEIKITESFHIPFEVKNAEINRYTVLRFKLTVRNCLTYMAYSFRESNSAIFASLHRGQLLKKVFALLGADSFLLEWIPFGKSYGKNPRESHLWKPVLSLQNRHHLGRALGILKQGVIKDAPVICKQAFTPTTSGNSRPWPFNPANPTVRSTLQRQAVSA